MTRNICALFWNPLKTLKKREKIGPIPTEKYIY